MPTGYTDKIKDGQSFEEFALNCARNFGACISLRDYPEKEVPIRFEPEQWYYEAVDKAQKEVDRVSSLSDKEAFDEMIDEYNQEVQSAIDGLDKCNKIRSSYEKMLKKALMFKAPTEEHKKFKSFMVEQIRLSIEHDCDSTWYEDRLINLKTPSDSDIKEWLDSKMKWSFKQLKRAKEALEKEEKLCEGRTKWVNDLKRAISEVD